MRKKHLTTAILTVVFLIGITLLVYPTLSDWWNSKHQTKAIAQYADQVSSLSEDKYADILESAERYNQALAQEPTHFELSDQETEEYNSQLSISSAGIMGYIDIPSIDCTLPIYHGTGDTALQSGVGHLAGSSLPVGGESTHCVLSGHRGLPSAKLFSNLNELTEGDLFILQVLDETLTYEVDQILIVEPNQTEALSIVPGEDYCTLVTCTPYGINTHRLLVRGHRVENQKVSDISRVTSDAIQMEPMVVAIFVAIPMVLVLVAILFTKPRRKK